MTTGKVIWAHLMPLGSLLGHQGSESLGHFSAAVIIEIVETGQTVSQFEIQKHDYQVSFTRYLVEVWHVIYTLLSFLEFSSNYMDMSCILSQC